MAKRGPRTSPCDPKVAAKRIADAGSYLELAELASFDQDPERRNSAAGNAVLSGIASADAACCLALGERSRDQDHRNATLLVNRIEPGGSEASKHLARLLGMKDKSHYGDRNVSTAELKAAIRAADRLLEFARSIQIERGRGRWE